MSYIPIAQASLINDGPERKQQASYDATTHELLLQILLVLKSINERLNSGDGVVSASPESNTDV